MEEEIYLGFFLKKAQVDFLKFAHQREVVGLLGKSLLKISSIQMFTSGVKLILGKRELKPGESTKLKVMADCDELQKARQTPRILMITNDPEQAKVTIDINVK